MQFVALRIDARQGSTRQWPSVLAQKDTIILQVRFRNGIRPVKVRMIVHLALPTSIPEWSQNVPWITVSDRTAMLKLPVLLQWRVPLPPGLYWYVVSGTHRVWIIPVEIRP